MSYTYVVAIEKHFIVVVVVSDGVAIVVIDVDAVLVVGAFDDADSTERHLRLFATAVQSRRCRHAAVPVFTRRRRRVDRKCQ